MIEKILERLESEARTSADAKTEAIIGMQGASANFYSGEVSAYDKAKKIVQELAKEYGKDTNVRSNGWIPCSERLPEEYCHCLVTYESKYDIGIRKDVYLEVEGEWAWQSEFEGMRDEVIAWQPLPAPYQKGE